MAEAEQASAPAGRWTAPWPAARARTVWRRRQVMAPTLRPAAWSVAATAQARPVSRWRAGNGADASAGGMSGGGNDAGWDCTAGMTGASAGAGSSTGGMVGGGNGAGALVTGGGADGVTGATAGAGRRGAFRRFWRGCGNDRRRGRGRPGLLRRDPALGGRSIGRRGAHTRRRLLQWRPALGGRRRRRDGLRVDGRRRGRAIDRRGLLRRGPARGRRRRRVGDDGRRIDRRRAQPLQHVEIDLDARFLRHQRVGLRPGNAQREAQPAGAGQETGTERNAKRGAGHFSCCWRTVPDWPPLYQSGARGGKPRIGGFAG